MTAAPKELASTLQTLSLHPSPSKSSSSFKKPQPSSIKTAPDSWDEEISSGSDTETEAEPASNPLSPQQSSSYPDAPPPTPISPTTNTAFASPFGYPGEGADGGRVERERRGDTDRRQDKTDAVAKRLIAGALGVKVPKKTEEQRAYERAVKEKEIKRRKEEKEMEERRKKEAEEMKKKVWDDD